MNDLITKTIDKYYRKKDLSEYLSKCQKVFFLPEEVKDFIENNNISITELNNGEIWPSSSIIFEYEKYVKGEFEVIYNSRLMISKIAPVFYLHHEFEVVNKDVNGINPTLDGFDTQPYNYIQAELELLIKNYFIEKEFTQLSFREMNEVVSELEFSKGITFFGSQVTVEHALFFDILDICPE